MKRIIGLTLMVFLVTAANGQRSIDNLFEKYGSKDGFVTVTINGNLLKLVSALEDESDNDNPIPSDITGIRILAVEEENDLKINFHDLVKDELDTKEYEEFMSVKESDQVVKMLVKTSGKSFTEFLLIVGGKDNAIIQIKGNMSFEEAKRFADDARKNKGNTININK